MILDIYDVEHGACALITTSNGRRVLIDSGHNASNGWRPGTFLRNAGITEIDRLCVTNYDEDHVSGLPDLLSNVAVHALFRNPSVLPQTIRYLKSEDGMGRGIETLVDCEQALKRGPPRTPSNPFKRRELFDFQRGPAERRLGPATIGIRPAISVDCLSKREGHCSTPIHTRSA